MMLFHAALTLALIWALVLLGIEIDNLRRMRERRRNDWNGERPW